MEKGKVWLVGAGPGDEGLITVKGARVLENANVVVYDKLVGDGIKKYIQKDAELIYVGKAAGNHSVPQEKINKILLDEAMKGKRVVRLKGGDPFLFGRGGEEITLLYENNIPFEVVPGVTSAIAASAYGGIPVTHRGKSSSVHIITAHSKNNNMDIDFPSLVKLNGTLVFLMGISHIGEIAKSLISAGMKEDMPCAVVESGTTSRQRKIISTLKNIENSAVENRIKTPGIIIVGEVCLLSHSYSWYEKLSLSGMKILVTRPHDLSSKLSSKLYDKGAEVVEIPTISTYHIDDNDFLKAIKNISEYEWIVLTSPTGVKIFFEKLYRNSIDIRSLYNIKFAAVGKSTSREIESRGIRVDFVPSIYDGENLAGEIKADGKVGVFRSKIGNEKMLEIFGKRNIDFEDIPIYYTESIKSNINPNEYDYVTFTSGSCVKGFIDSTNLDDYSNINAICIGKQTESAAKKYGMKTYTAKKATLDDMVYTLENIRGGKSEYDN